MKPEFIIKNSIGLFILLVLLVSVNRSFASNLSQDNTKLYNMNPTSLQKELADRKNKSFPFLGAINVDAGANKDH